MFCFPCWFDRGFFSVIIQSLNFGFTIRMESNEELRELTLLENIESDPDVNQSTLATQLGVAVGTVNWHLKRLIAKGYVKVKRAERKKLRYIITPEGIPCVRASRWTMWSAPFPSIAKPASVSAN